MLEIDVTDTQEVADEAQRLLQELRRFLETAEPAVRRARFSEGSQDWAYNLQHTCDLAHRLWSALTPLTSRD